MDLTIWNREPRPRSCQRLILYGNAAQWFVIIRSSVVVLVYYLLNYFLHFKCSADYVENTLLISTNRRFYYFCFENFYKKYVGTYIENIKL